MNIPMKLPPETGYVWPDNQTAFDAMCRHLKGMKHQSILTDAQTCAYRAPDGGMCVVGCLLPDNEVPRDSNPPVYMLIASSLKKLDKRLLTDLQMVHDALFCGNWNEQGFCAWHKIEAIAKQYSLVFTMPE